MQYLPTLIGKLRKVVDDGDMKLDEFERIKERWSIACHLSHGPNPQRAAYWERKAADLKRHIELKIAGEPSSYRDEGDRIAGVRGEHVDCKGK